MKQQPPSEGGFGEAGPVSGGAVPDGVPRGEPGAAAPGAAFGVAASFPALGVQPGAPSGASSAAQPGAHPGGAEPGAPRGAEPGIAGEGGSAWGLLLRGVDAVAGEETWRHGEEDLVQGLREYEAVRARLDAHRLALVPELDTRGWAARVGATSTQAWLAQALLIDPRTAAADVRAARALDPAGDAPPEPGVPVMTGARRSDADPVLAATGRALADGEVSRAHADAVLASMRALPAHPDPTRPDLVPEAEAFLLRQCAQFDPPTVRRLGR